MQSPAPIESRVASPPETAHVLFDGDCGFCKFWVARWTAKVREKIHFQSYQKAGDRYPEVPASRSANAVQFIDRDGSILSGSSAVFRILRSTGWRWLERIATAVPFLGKIAAIGYSFVAKNRPVFSLITRIAWGRDPAWPTFAVARRVFSHGLGLTFVAAFGSWLAQWKGLIGTGGISPVGAWMEPIHERLGTSAFWRVPSIFWLNQSDQFLSAAAWVGLGIAIVMTLGIAPGVCALILWALYLSISSVASPFLDFQWDILLLETALLAAVFLPWSLWPKWQITSRITTLGRWLLWWLVCRFTLESAIVKLSSGDPNWRNLTALSYHFETQPLPLPTAWLLHQTPLWWHRIESLLTFIIEFGGPLLMFGPRNLRHLAAGAMILLQVFILTSGNYAFFNWLTIGLCVVLIEDVRWPKRFRERLLGGADAPLHDSKRTVASWILEPIGIASAVIAGLLMWRTIDRSAEFISPIAKTIEWVQPFRSINSYGLFAAMTTKRPEIVVEGSVDGVNWQAYEFKYKPGALNRAPCVVAPHQPRLDWQMWFAALSDVRREVWFQQFLVRLLEGKPDVLALLEWNPFPGTPPRFVRAQFYDYHFTSWGENGWWKRELLGTYCPPISLSDTQSR